MTHALACVRLTSQDKSRGSSSIICRLSSLIHVNQILFMLYGIYWVRLLNMSNTVFCNFTKWNNSKISGSSCTTRLFKSNTNHTQCYVNACNSLYAMRWAYGYVSVNFMHGTHIFGTDWAEPVCVGVHGYFFHLKSQRYIDLLMVDKCTF